jgi:hypothetical protein
MYVQISLANGRLEVPLKIFTIFLICLFAQNKNPPVTVDFQKRFVDFNKRGFTRKRNRKKRKKGGAYPRMIQPPPTTSSSW